jgi:hypothetical protein
MGEWGNEESRSHLLEKEKCSLVVCSLPNLQQRLPRLLGGDVTAAIALNGLDLEVNDKALLNNGVLEHLL